MKEDWYKNAYGPSTAKTYETSLFNLITTEFGYISGPDIVRLFAQKIVELNVRPIIHWIYKHLIQIVPYGHT